MIKILALILMLFSLEVSARYTIEDIKKLHNDKEVLITVMSKKEKRWIYYKYPEAQIREKYKDIFYETVLNFLNSDNKPCDLLLVEELRASLTAHDIPSERYDVEEFLQVLRIHHAIDDLLYEILTDINKDYFGLQKTSTTRRIKPLSRKHSQLVEKNNISELFESFKEFPDEKSNCLYGEYNHILNQVLNREGKRSQSVNDFNLLTIKALEDEVITLSTFHKLNYLHTRSNISERELWLSDYLKIVLNAKNKMVPVNYEYQTTNLELEENFSSKRIKRFSKITRRKHLYRKYDETQIILLAQVLQNASRRMGVDADTETKRPYITQEYIVTNAEGERTNYVEVIELDPQSQFNLARRLLRKDVVQLQMMDIFVNKQITHEDIVMASLETGYISLEDIEYVIQYDDLWNPHKTNFEKIAGFIFTTAGYSTFFLPPPWNVTASIALGVVEGIVDNKTQSGAHNDNPGTFIE